MIKSYFDKTLNEAVFHIPQYELACVYAACVQQINQFTAEMQNFEGAFSDDAWKIVETLVDFCVYAQKYRSQFFGYVAEVTDKG